MRRELQRVDTLAARHERPDAEITEGTLKVTPLVNAAPEEAYVWHPNKRVAKDQQVKIITCV